jgi:hypothetical protein
MGLVESILAEMAATSVYDEEQGGRPSREEELRLEAARRVAEAAIAVGALQGFLVACNRPPGDFVLGTVAAWLEEADAALQRQWPLLEEVLAAGIMNDLSDAQDHIDHALHLIDRYRRA